MFDMDCTYFLFLSLSLSLSLSLLVSLLVCWPGEPDEDEVGEVGEDAGPTAPSVHVHWSSLSPAIECVKCLVG